MCPVDALRVLVSMGLWKKRLWHGYSGMGDSGIVDSGMQDLGLGTFKCEKPSKGRTTPLAPYSNI